MHIEVIVPEFQYDEYRRRAVVKVGDQLIMASYSDKFPPTETALCRIDTPASQFSVDTLFWCRSEVGISEALEALASMTKEQIDADEVDDPELEQKAFDFAFHGLIALLKNRRSAHHGFLLG